MRYQPLDMAVLSPALLEHFLAAYEARSLGRAASQLGLSQPALSKSIRKLEAALEVPLFDRTTSGIVPTVYAETLARRGRSISADVRNSIDELRMLRRGEAGEVRMGIAPALATEFMPRVILQASQRHPSLVIKVTEGLFDSLSRGVLSGELDFALTNLPDEGLAPGLAWQALFRDRFVVCCGRDHTLASRRRIQAEDLLDHSWITPPREGMAWQRLVDLFAAASCPPPRAAIATNSAALIKSVLCAGRFLTFVPRHFVLPDLQRGDVVELAVAGMTLERVVAVVARTGREHPTAARFVLQACEEVARRGSA